MMKRVVLFLLTNLAVMLVLDVVVNLLGLNTFISRSGLNLPVLFGFALVFGMGGSFISLLMSKWVAKASTGAEVIEHPRNAAEQWLVETVRRQAEQAGSASSGRMLAAPVWRGGGK
jgi:heat shock protein HtpX